MSREKFPILSFKNKHLVVLGLFLCVQFSNSFSQNTSFQEYEKRSFELYATQQWDSLISFNNKQLKLGNDYFYLRARTGIAYYSKGNFRKAIWNLEKAYRLNPYDSIATQYLYLAFLNSGCFQEAWHLERKNAKQLRNLTKQIQPKYFMSYFDAGGISSNNFTKNSEIKFIKKDSIYAEKDLYGSMYYSDLLFSRPISPSIYITIGAGYLNAQKRKITYYHSIVKSGYDTITNPGYYLDTVYTKNIEKKTENYPLQQFQFYFSPTFLLGRGLKILGGFSLLKTSYKTFITNYSKEEYYAQSYDTIPSIRTIYTFPVLDTSFINFSGSFGISKDIGKLQTGLNFGYSKINNKNQYFSSVTINFYPKGNLDTYVLSEMIVFHEKPGTDIIIQLNAGKKIINNTWLDLSFSVGKMRNFSEKYSYLIYNSGDETYLKAGSGLLYSITNNLNIHLKIQTLFNRGSYFSINEDNTFNYKQYNYQNINITGGLLWKI